MGWGNAAVPVPMAERDCGCWKPEKPEVVVTQELRERLSEAVNAEPERDGWTQLAWDTNRFQNKVHTKPNKNIIHFWTWSLDCTFTLLSCCDVFV